MSELFTCPECKEKNNMLEPTCWRCVRPFTESEKDNFFAQAKKSEERKERIASLTPELQYIENIKLAKETTDWSGISEEDIEKETDKIILTRHSNGQITVGRARASHSIANSNLPLSKALVMVFKLESEVIKWNHASVLLP